MPRYLDHDEKFTLAVDSNAEFVGSETISGGLRELFIFNLRVYDFSGGRVHLICDIYTYTYTYIGTSYVHIYIIQYGNNGYVSD